jgi:hypothetical protein
MYYGRSGTVEFQRGPGILNSDHALLNASLRHLGLLLSKGFLICALSGFGAGMSGLFQALRSSENMHP